MESRVLIRKIVCIIIAALLFGLCIYLIKQDFESANNRDRDLARKYVQCLRENFNQRSDCARDVSEYSYKYLDKLVEQFKIQK